MVSSRGHYFDCDSSWRLLFGSMRLLETTKDLSRVDGFGINPRGNDEDSDLALTLDASKSPILGLEENLELGSAAAIS